MTVSEALYAQGGVLVVIAFVAFWAAMFYPMVHARRAPRWLIAVACMAALAAVASFITGFWLAVDA